jgi:hypothetical protein
MVQSRIWSLSSHSRELMPQMRMASVREKVSTATMTAMLRFGGGCELMPAEPQAYAT